MYLIMAPTKSNNLAFFLSRIYHILFSYTLIYIQRKIQCINMSIVKIKSHFEKFN